MMTTALTRPPAKRGHVSRTFGRLPDGGLRVTDHHEKKRPTTRIYDVQEIVCETGGRGFTMVKRVPIPLAPADEYAVFVAGNGRDHDCDCPAAKLGGFKYGICAHLESVMDQITKGKL